MGAAAVAATHAFRIPHLLQSTRHRTTHPRPAPRSPGTLPGTHQRVALAHAWARSRTVLVRRRRCYVPTHLPSLRAALPHGACAQTAWRHAGVVLAAIREHGRTLDAADAHVRAVAVL